MRFGGQDPYATLAEKAAGLGYSLVLNHPFVDGNKRTQPWNTYSRPISERPACLGGPRRRLRTAPLTPRDQRLNVSEKLGELVIPSRLVDMASALNHHERSVKSECDIVAQLKRYVWIVVSVVESYDSRIPSNPIPIKRIICKRVVNAIKFI